MEGFKKTDKAKDKVVKEYKENLQRWYVSVCSKLPEEYPEKEVHTVDGTLHLWWMEPLIEDVKNPLLIHGDTPSGWKMWIEELERKPRIYIP